MTAVLVLQHVAHEGPALIAELAAERGWPVTVIHSGAGEAVPTDLPAGTALVVMGGPMGVGDLADPRYPFLAAEVALLRTLLQRDHPILGICLGAQLIAHAAGARVYPNEHLGQRVREVGWGPVDVLVPNDPVLAGLDSQVVVLHWHGDTFDLPSGAIHLASTPLCRHQMFRLGRAYALQFHAEVDPTIVARWADLDADYVRLANGPDGVPHLLAETERCWPLAAAAGRTLVGNLLGSFGARRPA